jgi:uncharacterized protein
MSSIFGDSNPDYIFGIVLMTLLLFFSMWIPVPLQHEFGFGFRTMYIISRLLFWLCLFAMGLYALWYENNKFLLWEESKFDFISYLMAITALIGILFAGNLIIGAVSKFVFHLKSDSPKMEQMITHFKQNKMLLYLTVITAGVVEELLFRGYMQTRLQTYFKKPIWPIAISSALFASMHISYGTIMQVIGPLFIGTVFAIFYYKYRNIKVLIITHILWDLMVISVLITKDTVPKIHSIF